jgi:hypothetical protein
MIYVPSASTRPNNDIFVSSKINSSSQRSEGCERADCLLEAHCYKRMLMILISIRAKEWPQKVTYWELFEMNEQRLSAGLLKEVIVYMQDDVLILARAPPFDGLGFT